MTKLPKKVKKMFDKLLHPQPKPKGVKFRKYGKAPVEDEIFPSYSKWVCSCHDSMEDHFKDIAKKDGVAVARECYALLATSIANTEREIMMEQFDAAFEEKTKEDYKID